jgi:hypothetical protein
MWKFEIWRNIQNVDSDSIMAAILFFIDGNELEGLFRIQRWQKAMVVQIAAKNSRSAAKIVAKKIMAKIAVEIVAEIALFIPLRAEMMLSFHKCESSVTTQLAFQRRYPSGPQPDRKTPRREHDKFMELQTMDNQHKEIVHPKTVLTREVLEALERRVREQMIRPVGEKCDSVRRNEQGNKL